MSLRTIISAAGLLLAAVCAAQDSMSLRECISYANEHSLSVLGHNLEVEDKRNNYVKSIFALLPSLALYGTGDFNWGKSVDMQELIIISNKMTKSVNLSVGSSWEFFHGFSKQYRRLSAKLELDAAELAGDKLKNDLSINVSKAYLELILSEEISECSKRNYARILEEKKTISALVEAGSQPFSSLRQIEVQACEEMVSMVNAEYDRKHNIMALSQLINIPYNRNFRTVRPEKESLMATPLSLSYDQIREYAAANPQILQLEKLKSSTESNIMAAKGEAAPSFTISAGYGTYYSGANTGSFSRQLKDNRNPSVELGVSIPLFDRLERTTQIKNSITANRRIILEIEKQTKGLIAEIQNAILEAERLYEKVVSCQDILESKEALMEDSSEKYRIGSIATLEFTTARNDYLKAQSEYLSSKWQYIFQLKILDLYRGIPIDL